MADHLSFPIDKYMSKENFLKLLNKNDNSLIYHKYCKDGINFPNLIFSNDDWADDEIIDLAGKWDPIIAVKVLNKEPASLKTLNAKINDLNREVRNLAESISSFGDFYKDIVERVFKEKSKTKSCRHCGHRHNTDVFSWKNLSPGGCKNCNRADYLFTKSDDKKLLKIKEILNSKRTQLDELTQKRSDKINKAFKSRNWHWFISAGTKSVADDLKGYDCDY